MVGSIAVGFRPWGIVYDSTDGNLYVTNSIDHTVSVISGVTNTIIDSPIPVGVFPEGIAFDSANGNLYVANSGDNSVSVISTAAPLIPPDTTITSAGQPGHMNKLTLALSVTVALTAMLPTSNKQ
ncbi:MAG: hypothetical protein M3044_03965 [Thermoproteota archaeon]|nr:hypothetical protein [Thermoproteota archaeon]